MRFLDGWARYTSERASHTRTRQAYDLTVVAYREAVKALDDAGQRIHDLEHHVELMACDNADLERTVEAMRDGLRWFDPEAKR